MAKKKTNIEKPPPAYLLAYTMRSNFNGKERDTDSYEIFCDYDEMERSNEEQAFQRMQEIRAAHENDEVNELYCWNIAAITKTSEHYETSPSPVAMANALQEIRKAVKASQNDLNDIPIDHLLELIKLALKKR